MSRSARTDRTAVRIASCVLTVGACLALSAFVVLRAVRVALTYDEAATCLKYICTDALSVFNFAYATNHVLNTLLAKILYLFGGRGDLMLRMPSLIGYGLYLGFSLLILRGLPYRAIALAGFLLLNLNPYLLEYFSLSRGYGLSLGLLMGALFFFFAFLRQMLDGGTPFRDLTRALAFATAAVLANFALLNVYVGLWAIALSALLVVNRAKPATAAREPGQDVSHRPRGRTVPWLPIVAGGFTLLVFSQDVGLTGRLYQPVVVRLTGLTESDAGSVRVARTDFRGQETVLSRHADGWRLDSSAHFTGLRVELPLLAADRLRAIEVLVGTRSFLDDGRGGLWTRRDVGTIRVLESGPSLSLRKSRVPAFRSTINWGGDARYLAYLSAYTALALCVLGLLAVSLRAIGAAAARAHLLTADQWRPLATSALWLVGLVGGPLYLLKRDDQLYFGGSEGIVQDTFHSLLDYSFHGKAYYADQVSVAFYASVASVAAFLVVSYVHYRRGTLRRMLSGACVLALLVVVSLAALGEHIVLSTPYLEGRTALFYIPLYVLFAVFLCDGIADLGRGGRISAACVLAPALVFATYHFLATANLEYTWEWPRDAGTKMMIADLGQLVARERPVGSRVVLAVYWEAWPVAAVYASQDTAAQIDVVTEPPPSGSDFQYLKDRDLQAGANVIRNYPVAGSVLIRTR